MKRTLATALTLLAACAAPSPVPTAPPPPAPAAEEAPVAPVPASVASPAPLGSSVAAPPPAPVGPARPRNVVLVSIDSLRADALTDAGARARAPNLTKLADASVRFTRAYALSSVTAKSLGGLLAARYPSELDRTYDFFPVYSEENVFFAESLAPAGKRAVAAHAHWSLSTTRGMNQGFDVWKLLTGLNSGPAADEQITGDRLTPLAKEVLGEAGAQGSPFFAWFHYVDPHQKYLHHADAPAFGVSPRQMYDGEVWFADRWVGELLAFVEAAPWGKDTAVLVTADHGEAFLEHKMGGHAFEVWEELVRVPLLVKVPGVTPGERTHARSHLDLGRTILDLMDVPAPATLRGESLWPELLGKEAPPRTVICDLPEDPQEGRRRAVIDGDSKLVILGAGEKLLLFDLARDPGETKELSRERPEELARMKKLYDDSERSIVRKKPRGQK